MKSIYLAAAALLCSAAIASAQEAGSTVSQDSKTELLNVDVKARADWQGLWDDGNTNDANTGFEGKYLMLKLDGEIVPGLKYAWRQRFNKSVVDGNFFDATDWINLTYSTHNFGQVSRLWASADTNTTLIRPMYTAIRCLRRI